MSDKREYTAQTLQQDKTYSSSDATQGYVQTVQQEDKFHKPFRGLDSNLEPMPMQKKAAYELTTTTTWSNQPHDDKFHKPFHHLDANLEPLPMQKKASFDLNLVCKLIYPDIIILTYTHLQRRTRLYERNFGYPIMLQQYI